MKPIQELEFPKIRDIEFKGLIPRNKRYFKMYLYLGKNQDNEEIANGASLNIGLDLNNTIVEMPDMLEYGYIPPFTIHKDCFLEECVLGNESFKSAFECLSSMVLVKSRIPKVTLTKEGNFLQITLTIKDFVTETTIAFEEVSDLFK